MPPPLRPEDRAEIALIVKRAIDAAIPNAVQPLQDQVDRLKGTDERHDERLRTHSGTHRDIASNVRKSVDEVKETTNADLLRATTHLASEIGEQRAETSAAFEAMRTEFDTKLQATFTAASASALAASQAKHATTDNAVAAVQTTDAVKKNNRDSTLRTIGTLLTFILIALWNHFAKGCL